ncbi:hypothetical protein [Flavobacterium soyae]|uniref:hypothetical protein n=1 Tax=Flavobacterium soyae TaxID=2903098 RepID=UPI001E39EB8E|nr:hypothetical protein [Flavobacterium soyae]MCD9576639.1 hypothetical protein [Flavobacterium soyae]
MKKRILLVAVLQLFLTLNSCSSDSESQPGTNPIEKGEIVADYIIDGYVDDFVIGTDNIVYKIGQTDDEKGSRYMGLKKVDPQGKETALKYLDLGNFNFANLTFANNGDLLMVAKGNTPGSDKILRFENNFSDLKPFYTMKPISSPFASKINLLSISNNGDNTFFVFDYGNRQIKRFFPELSGDMFVAGSEKNEIKDGTGLNASFGTVLKMISLNNVQYIIDNFYESSNGAYKSSNIRKVEYVNNEWKVTTLISTTNDESYNDITFDSKNDLYVAVKGKGIYKLNLQDNSLSSFKEGEFKVRSTGQKITNSFGSIKMIKFIGNDMYMATSSDLIKISDFQTKFAKAAAEK